MPSAKFEIKRKCKCCGATFLAKTLDSWYCSRKCYQKAYDQRMAEKKKVEQLNAIKDTIYRLIRKGKVSAINIGERLTRISKSKMEEMFPLREEPIDRSKPLPKFYSMEPEDCYTIGEISKKFGINDSTVYAHIRKYSIPTRQIGNYVYAPKTEIDNLYKDVVKL